MARPNKIGLEYFSLDVKMDDEVELIKAQHGMSGFGILISMFQTIYADKGYYRKWNERNQILFSNKISVNRNEVMNIIDGCIKWDIFDKKIYEKYEILTSRRIQKQYIKATYKRTEVEVIEEYLLLKHKDIDRENITCISVSDIGNSNTSGVSDGKSTHSIRIKDKDKDKESNKVHSPAKKQDIPYKEIIVHLNNRTGSKYKPTTSKTQKLIKARWNEGFRLEDFKTVIDKKSAEWLDDKKMEVYLRPPTLFGPKFESYLNQLSDDSSNDEEKMMEKYRKDDLILTDEEREKLGLNKPRKNMWETEEE